MMRALCTALITGLIALPALAQPAETPAFPDSLGTVETTLPIPSRGNLGGVAVDALGYVYVANFREGVWRIAPDGETVLMTNTLYGASGNTLDRQGRLLQANFLGHTITRIDRDGTAETVVEDGLNGPVGLVEAPDGSLYVCNCNANAVVRVAPDRTVRTVAEGERFACPNGITYGPDGALYVVNFNTDDVLRLDPETGALRVLATLPPGGNAHIAFARGNFYVTKITTNQVYRVTPEGAVTLVAGTGAVGHDDGPALAATLSRPNGIAAGPTGAMLYINTLVGTWNGGAPATIAVRRLKLASLTDAVLAALDGGTPGAVEATIRRFRAERPDENTLAESIALGYRLLSGGQVPASLTVFRLNAEAYPDQPPAHYHLGEGYRYTGQSAPAIAAYERTLELDPAHQNATNRLSLLRGN